MDIKEVAKKGNAAVQKKYGKKTFSKGGKKSRKKLLESMSEEQKKEYFSKISKGISPLS